MLRALGAAPSTTTADGLVGIAGAIVVGAVIAAVVAVALSPLAPLGPVRSVYPGSAVAVDWTVLGIGLVALIFGLWSIALGLAYRGAPHRVARRDGLAPLGASRAVHVVTSTGLPPPAAVGVRFAVESGRGRTAVPVRSALLGAVLAVALVVRDPDVRQRSAIAGLAPLALRVELDLHAQSHQYRPLSGSHLAQTRS